MNLHSCLAIRDTVITVKLTFLSASCKVNVFIRMCVCLHVHSE